MKNDVLIFCHSPSGNTQWVADKLAACLADRGITAAIRNIACQPNNTDLDTHGLIGFGCPVMGFRPSCAMVRFIQSLPRQTQKPAFIFSTYAGVLANTPWTLSEYLRERGFLTLAHRHFRGEVSWPMARIAGLILNRGLPDDTTLPSIAGFANMIAEHLVKHKSGIPPRPAVIPRSRINPFHYLSLLNRPNRLRLMMGKKKINTVRCTKCGRCVQQCAAGAITLAPYPVFSKTCDGCWGCFNVCPTGAISTIVGNRGRYNAKLSSSIVP